MLSKKKTINGAVFASGTQECREVITAPKIGDQVFVSIGTSSV